MNERDISKTMQSYVDNNEMPGAALIVRKNSEIVYNNKWGYADVGAKTPVTDGSIYRMASMTKCVVAVAIMRMVEDGGIALDDPVSKYIPAFSKLRVADDKRYKGYSKTKLIRGMLLFRMDKVRTVAAEREITIRDLLSHASGLEQGLVGMLGMLKLRSRKDTLKERVERYANFALDFQPGTATSYSPCASFDILGYILELVSGENAEGYLKKAVFEPLDMPSASFCPGARQMALVAHIYKRVKGKLVDVSGTKDDIDHLLCRGQDNDYVAGSGGLYCTAEDYEHMVQMLCDEGQFNGKQYLKPETVQLMHTEAQEKHLEPEPGFVWGLGVKIRQDPVRGNTPATAGTYGWSGAAGTHFFISPSEKLEAVFVTSRSDLGGSGSYISKKVEELVFGLYGGI